MACATPFAPATRTRVHQGQEIEHYDRYEVERNGYAVGRPGRQPSDGVLADDRGGAVPIE